MTGFSVPASESEAEFSLIEALDFASTLTAPQPGGGETRELWQLLARLAARDLQLARTVEPHLDALAIIHESGLDMPTAGTWGVYAAEGAGVRLDARDAGGRWLLNGIKPWCSLAGSVDHALVTAHIDTERRLFAVDMKQGGVTPNDSAWVARGLSDIPSGPVEFVDAVAVPVGDAGWYLDRAGFAWGGIGVAACWYGGAVALARSVHAIEKTGDAILDLHLGVMDARLYSAAVALADAATQVDAGHATGERGSLLAKRVRSIVAEACEVVLERTAHALGPAPLALDAEHARRVADLTLYIRQHHAERDLASLGAAVRREPQPW